MPAHSAIVGARWSYSCLSNNLWQPKQSSRQNTGRELTIKDHRWQELLKHDGCLGLFYPHGNNGVCSARTRNTATQSKTTYFSEKFLKKTLQKKNKDDSWKALENINILFLNLIYLILLENIYLTHQQTLWYWVIFSML